MKINLSIKIPMWLMRWFMSKQLDDLENRSRLTGKASRSFKIGGPGAFVSGGFEMEREKEVE